jgi:hypothetical protein
MTGYVGYAQVNSVESLESLVERYIKPSDNLPSGHFLRWVHQVSGMRSGLPTEFSSLEGQAFNIERELRWRQEGTHYAVLLLSQVDIKPQDDFQALPGNWQTETKGALCHNPKNPQYPNQFHYDDGIESQLRQCYFRNGDTSTVHFVALTLKP